MLWHFIIGIPKIGLKPYSSYNDDKFVAPTLAHSTRLKKYLKKKHWKSFNTRCMYVSSPADSEL